MSVHCITFDLDDTLWPIKPVILNAEKATRQFVESEASSLVGIFSFDTLSEIRKTVIKDNPALKVKLTQLRKEVYLTALISAGTPNKLAEELATQAVAVFLEHRNKVELFEGVEESLEKLSGHFCLGAVTNGNVQFQQLPIAKYFDFYLSAENVGAAKPNKKIFDRAIALAKSNHGEILSPDQICHVGDDLHYDVFGANNAAILSCWLPHADMSEEDINDAAAIHLEEPKKKPNIIIRHISELHNEILNL